MNIAIVALESINNIGETILAETTAFLVRRICPDAKISRVQFCPNGCDGILAPCHHAFLARLVLRLSKWTHGGVAWRFKNLYFRLRLGNHFLRALRASDAVVMAVGAFKFSSQDFSYLYNLVAEKASDAGCPLMLSAASIAVPDVRDWRSRQLAQALAVPCWRMCSTRDGEMGIARLRSGYRLPSSVPVKAVGDPALWLPDLTGVSRVPKSERRYVGVNLIRGKIYKAYRGGVSEEQLLEVYRVLLSELDARGIEWRLFSNGIRSDERFGDLLCARLNIPPNRRLPPPVSIHKFAQTVASFRAVFGARLHACLTSVAFRVPSVWLNWDDKFVYTADALGYSRALLEPRDLEGGLMVDRLEEMMARPFDDERIRSAKVATVTALAEFLGKR